MFFNQIRRNNQKSRKENGIYYACLIIAIIACYVVLALSKQDVMVFLHKMESDAVNKLYMLLNVVFVLALFLVFFLIYFAQKYQLERQKHEFGVMLMLGMKRSRLFFFLMLSDVASSVRSLVIGLPVAVLLSEGISLVTARIIGLGIIGHQFSFSLSSLLLTSLGFFGVKLFANIILSAKLVRKEPDHLLRKSEESEKKHKMPTGRIWFFLGSVLLIAAYVLACFVDRTWASPRLFLIMLVVGAIGSRWLIGGFCGVFGHMSGTKSKEQLSVFTFRQLQENVFQKTTSLTVSSLLILIGIVCFGYGIAIALSNAKTSTEHTMDVTAEVYEESDEAQFLNWTQEKKIASLFSKWQKVSVCMLHAECDYGKDSGMDKIVSYQTDDLKKAATHLKGQDRELFQNQEQFYLSTSPYMIAENGFNGLRHNAGRKELSLKDGELAIYIDHDFDSDGRIQNMYEKLLAYDPVIKIDGKQYRIKAVCHDDIVVDRSITIGFGLVVPDELFTQLADEKNISSYYNGYLKASYVKEHGLLHALQEVLPLLHKSGFQFENYLQNMGRQLFYIVAASYLTIYLAVIFLLIANTTISLQYMMQEEKMSDRYRTMYRLGCTKEQLFVSSKRQIKWYFGVPVGTAMISSLFGVSALFRHVLPYDLQSQISVLLLLAAVVIAGLVMVEYCYMRAVIKNSYGLIGQLQKLSRTE